MSWHFGGVVIARAVRLHLCFDSTILTALCSAKPVPSGARVVSLLIRISASINLNIMAANP